MEVLRVIHSFYALFGVFNNLVLITIILRTKNSGLNSYAVLIFNVAAVDIIEIVLDACEVPRMVVYWELSILLFHGPCTNFGPEVCYRAHLVMLHLMFHSMFLIAFSFWYRYNILVKSAPSWYTIQAIIFVLLIPNAVPVVLSFYATDEPARSAAVLHDLYPTMNVNKTTHRSVNLFDPFSAPTDYSALFGSSLVYTFIVIMRRKVLRALAALAHNMSEKTKQMHDSLIRALTYHALLPGTICIGIASFWLQMAGIRSPAIDGLIFIFACIPAIFNPLLSLYFVAPYRRKLMGTIGRSKTSAVTSLSLTMDPDSRIRR